MKIIRKTTISKSLLVIFIITLFFQTSFYNTNVAFGVTSSTTVATSSKTLNLIAGGATVTLTSTVSPSTAVNKAVIWSSSDNTIATVSQTGVVTPIAAGTALIKVQAVDGGYAAFCYVTVTNVAVTGITLKKYQATLKIGATVTVSPVVAPTDASNKSVTYSSSNPSVAKVSAAGVITATAIGSSIISVQTVDRGYTTLFIVYVPATVDSITLSNSSLKFKTGDTSVKLGAKLMPDNLSVRTVLWTSSNSNIASVDSNGNVTPQSAGTATITGTSALDSTKKATCSVTVTSSVDTTIHPYGITLNAHEESMTLGTTFTLTEVITPSTAVNKTVTWSSSDNTIATVSASGVVTPIAVGSALIKVQTVDGSCADACFVTVTKEDVTGITLKKYQATLKIGATVTISPVIAPTNASDKSVTYSSSNPSIANVSAAGVITATAVGNSTISVQTVDRGYTTLFFVSVPATAVTTSITLNKSSLTFNNITDPSVTLTAVLRPNTLSVKTVMWTSSNSSVASVDSNGKVTPESGGTAVITATSLFDTTKKATCNVTVVQHATGVTIK